MSTMHMRLSDIYIRDPFILPVAEEGMYYLYGTNRDMWDTTPPGGFHAYRSPDLTRWEGPFPIFKPPPDFWGNTDFWAPEVYRWNDGYAMLASFTRNNNGPFLRGVQLLRSQSPLGPFIADGNAPLTPPEDYCIDGTLFIDAHNQPWLVYAGERMQTICGRMVAARLAPDLSRMVGEPTTLFTGQQVAWNSPLIHQGRDTWCAEGPWFHRTSSGALLLFWSGFLPGFNYVVAAARSRSGRITGPWDVTSDPIFSGNGGHGMSFRSFEGTNLFILHSPGFTKDRSERARLFELDETGPRLLSCG